MPPKILIWLLHKCCPEDRLDILGDFEEWYQDILNEKGRLSANLTWFLHSLTMLRLKAVAKTKNTQKLKHNTIMLGLNLKIARRNLLKNKAYTLINILGLGVGLAACTLIYSYVQDELSYDKHFKDFNQIYRISGEYNQGGDISTKSVLTTWMLLPAIQGQFENEIVYTRLDFGERLVKVRDRFFWEPNSLIVDSTFFDVFGVDALAGDLATALDGSFGAVVDQTLARKYFGENDPLGKEIEVNGYTYQINAVIPDLPRTTHFESNLFLSMRGTVNDFPEWVRTNSTGVSHLTYVKLPASINSENFETQLTDYLRGHWNIDESRTQRYFLQPVADIHLKSDLVAEVGRNSDYSTIYIFIGTAFIILLLACINYVNLSVAGSIQRSKEVALKKVMGASRSSQVFQFQVESILLGLTAAILAVLLVDISLPFFNDVTDKELSFSLPGYLVLGLILFGFTIVISLVTGSFPALFLLRLPIIQSLVGSIDMSPGKKLSSRNVLVALQFFIAAVLISSTFIIMYQIRYMKKKDLGIDTDQLLMVPFQTGEAFTNYKVYKQELLAYSDIVSVAASTSRITGRIGGWRGYRPENSEEHVNCPTVVVSHDFFETLEAQIIEGRSFSKDFPSDFTEAFVINEAAKSFFNIEEPVDKKLHGWAFTGSDWTEKDARIIGVVKDFHFASLRDKIRPTVFSLSSDITMPLNWMTVKVNSPDLEKTLEKMENSWNKINPERPFRYQFVDEELEEHYAQERTFLKVFTAFAGLSIFIGCLGLFGLTAFIMKKRTKEIGIRKILGASFGSLLHSLSKDFLQLVMISSILGSPVTIWLMVQWLENFEYRISITWIPFALTCLTALAIAVFSILYHSLKVANANPVESIRHE